MQIQVNYANVPASAALEQFIDSQAGTHLGRFRERLTRIEVHVEDENGPGKSGPADKRCMIEARPAGKQPMIVEDRASDVYDAVRGAFGKMERLIGRMHDREVDSRRAAS